jgi:putative FmdB family regulatory protein
MPIYEFECGGCGHRFDRLQKLSDEDPSICPVCAAPQLHRRVSAPSFRLAGSGWYETDFKKEGDKKRNLVEGSSGSSAGAGENSATSTSTPAPAAAPAAPAPSSKPSAAE